MASLSVTYTFANSTVADANQVNQNFTDIINGTSDGTKDFSIAAITAAGTATFNGNVSIGNASGDDLTITASLASSIPIKTTNSYDLGSSTLGLRALYFGNAGGSTTINIISAASVAASRTYTLPDVGAAAKFVMDTMTTPVVVDGSTDAIQFRVQGNATQTADIVVVENSAGTDILQIATTGITITGFTKSLSGTAAGIANGGTFDTLTNTQIGSTTGWLLFIMATGTDQGESAIYYVHKPGATTGAPYFIKTVIQSAGISAGIDASNNTEITQSTGAVRDFSWSALRIV